MPVAVSEPALAMHVLLALLLSTLVAQVEQPSPSLSPSPVPAKETLTISLPDGWVRTESGRYSAWLSPDKESEFRVSVMPLTQGLRGPDVADAVKEMFEKQVATFNPAATITVHAVHVCNGQQNAYRVNDPLGLGSAGFMVIVPGTDSAGFVSYEVKLGGKPDSRIQSTIDKLCWP
jgi:hypothetical protein